MPRMAITIVSMIAEEGIRAMSASLPVVVKEPANLEARSQALYGAWLGGVSLGSAGMALHHKLCHTLGGVFNFPHAEAHTVILPHAVAYNTPAVPEAMARVTAALTTENPLLQSAPGDTRWNPRAAARCLRRP
jgi:maleylacetate reductase